MDQTCEKCGEVLVGVVNRCWKCGTEMDVVTTARIPPIRRGPVDLSSHSASVPNIDAYGGDPFSQLLPVGLMPTTETGRHRCAKISVAAGTLGCLAGIMTGWALMFGMIGIGFGFLGVHAKRRDLATMGLVLSVLAFFLGMGQIGFDAWTRYESQQWIEELQGIQD